MFEEQTDLEKIVRKIMQRALTLLQCERCSVLLLEDIDSPVSSSSTFRVSPHRSICLDFMVYRTWPFPAQSALFLGCAVYVTL